MNRISEVHRKTAETAISVKLNLDGQGRCQIDSDVPFLNHMLTLFAAHGFLDLELSARGDTHIDDHHTVEDMGICLGTALRRALGDKTGIRRYGSATVPMDETLARVVLDISGRPYLAYRVAFPVLPTGKFDFALLKEFFRALSVHGGMTLHIDLLSGEEAHHIAEAIFKAFGRAVDQACSLELRREGSVPSTKGTL